MILQGRREGSLQGKRKVQDPVQRKHQEDSDLRSFPGCLATFFFFNSRILKLHCYMQNLGLSSLDRAFLSLNP